ncbi:hypothetical protein CGCF413_v005656 [Colletotrichum fructicola]|nr:hypothetical protein CGCF413_v005656 [Colletotrichum fructicola]
MDTESPSVICICQDHEEEALAVAVLGSDDQGLPVTETNTHGRPTNLFLLLQHVHRLHDKLFKPIIMEQAYAYLRYGPTTLLSINDHSRMRFYLQKNFDIFVHNATTNQTRSSSSRGVTIAPRYVDRARRFGTNGDANYGNITVGKVMAARVPQLDHADWHGVVAGISRYDLLAEAIAKIQIPW